VLFSQCTGDDSTSSNDPDSSNLEVYTLSVGNDFFTTNSSGILYITNDEGEILGQEMLSNSQQASIEIEYDPNETYDATVYLETSTSGFQYYFLNTYLDVPPGDFTIPGLTDSNPNDAEITINITNVGGVLEVISTSTIMDVVSNPNNGGTYEFSGLMLAAPGDYYIAVQKTTEPFPRYVWLEDVAGNLTINVDFNTLPEISNLTTVSLPPNNSSSFTVYGIKNGDPQGIDGIFHTLFYSSKTDGTSIYDAVVPTNLFNKYRLDARYSVSNDGIQYSYTSTNGTIPQTIPPVNLHFSVNSNTISNFSMITQGNYDYFQTSFNYTNSTQQVVVFHYIFGAAANTINFSKAQLFDNILIGLPNIHSGILQPSESYSLNNYSQFSGYTDFLNAPWIYGPELLDNEFIESIAQ